MQNTQSELIEQWPFLTYLKYGDEEFVGIVQNSDDYVTCIYDFSMLMSDEDKMAFLEYGEVWWWECNRNIPINIFLRNDWNRFSYCLKTLITKDVTILSGPSVNLKELAATRSKKRSITLVKKI